MELNTPTPVVGIEVLHGISEGHTPQAAEVYYAAFHRKLVPILGTQSQSIAILKASLYSDNAFTAVQENQLLGLVGFHHGGRQLLEIGPGPLIKAHGILNGTWRIILGSLLTRRPKHGELLLDGIAVHPAARGKGIGTRLIEAMVTFAREHRYAKLRLEVVNTNPLAQRLYERLGFVSTGTVAVPFMRNLGFTAVTTMFKELP